MTDLVAVAWDNVQGRTLALAAALGGTAFHIKSWRGRKPLLPFRYLVDAVRMWQLLRRHRPRVILVIVPPPLAPLVAWWWCLTHHCQLVIDCHTSIFHSRKWRWSCFLLRPAFRQAAAVLTHTNEDEQLVRGWGGAALLLPDDLPKVEQAQAQPSPPRPRIVVAGSLDGFEPVEATLAAARLLPEADVHFTGLPTRIPSSVRRAAPDNAVFTGWLDYPRFLGELLGADVVAVFSTDPHIMNRSAFEAIGMGRPLVLSDLPGLRSRFGEAALFSANDPQAMAAVLRRALAEQEDLTVKSVWLRGRLQAHHVNAVRRLQSMLGGTA